jgi:hypothetical protein
MQFYTGGFLGDQVQTADAKDGAMYPRFGGLCLEAQVCVGLWYNVCAKACVPHTGGLGVMWDRPHGGLGGVGERKEVYIYKVVPAGQVQTAEAINGTMYPHFGGLCLEAQVSMGAG